jgi:hypothetical protein
MTSLGQIAPITLAGMDGRNSPIPLKTPVRFGANGHSISAPAAMEASMMGEKRGAQGQVFYEFDLEAMVPQDHLLRKIDAVLDLSGLRAELARHYSHTGQRIEPPRTTHERQSGIDPHILSIEMC